MNLPDSFVQRMTTLLDSETASFLDSLKQKKAIGLRVNTLKVNIDDFHSLVPFPLEPIPFCPSGFYINEEDQAGKHPFHHAGLFYIQEPSAMFVVEALDPQPGEKVLDLCAAPGGKTTHIAAKMKEKGLLISNDIHPKRVKALSQNVERLGITNTIVTNESPERLSRLFNGYFDRILVDAPCSGEGMFRKDPEAIDYWSPQHVAECVLLQKDILDNAYHMLREGGTLVYSTCTFSPEENENQIDQFLQRYPEMELVSIEKKGGISDGIPSWSEGGRAELKNTARLWPHCLKGEGHFVAKIRKRGSAVDIDVKLEQGNINKRELKDYTNFERTYLQKKNVGPMMTFRDQLFLLPEETPTLPRLKYVRPGLHLGTLKKNRFEPNHAFAMAMKIDDVKNYIELSETDLYNYLRGETVQTKDDRGWLLVTFHGYPIGWGKEVKGTMKNFYPKGLRIKGTGPI